MKTFSELLSKYDVPTPRYTSYPTVPYWEGTLTPSRWEEALTASVAKKDAKLALYLHLPFCESLCFFCGCNTVITKNHSQEIPYVQTLLQELKLYVEKVPGLATVDLQELHIGGGTPTFFSPHNLSTLLDGVFKYVKRSPSFNGSIEIDPRHFSAEQMQVLQSFGFKRISLGVQDFDPDVQKAVNRIQPFEMTKLATEIARSHDVSSVNFDLIYGLPLQTKDTIKRTVEQVLELRPDRIAFYSFAHVPWIKQAHEKLAKSAAIGAEKRELYEIGRDQLLEAGYLEIGMDHFALPSDALSKALKDGYLHRNFMGYVEQSSDILLGLGVSSISSCRDAYSQNQKTIKEYQAAIEQGSLPVMRGHVMSEEDKVCYEHIQQVMTQGKTSLDIEASAHVDYERLRELGDDGLIEITHDTLIVSDLGRTFLRNIAVAFDNRLHRAKPESIMFSRAV